MKKDIAVIGLGIFGFEVAVQLQNKGNDVLAVDISRQRVDQIKDYVTAAVSASITDIEAMKELDVASFDLVILGLGSNFEQLALGITYLKKLGVEQIIARANTEIQQEILLKLGASQVVLPEKQSAERVASIITMPNIMELFELDEGISLSEVKVGKGFAGKSIQQLDLRKKYNITALIVKRSGRKTKIITDPGMVLQEEDNIVVVGNKEDIIKIFS